MRALADITWITKYLEARGRRPIYYVTIEKSEGTTDPDGGSSVWPGTGDGADTRIFTTGTVSWSDRATLLSDLVLDEGRMNRDSVGDIVFQVRADRDPGGLADQSDFDFWLDNTGGFEAELEADGVSFAGRKCTLRITFGGETARANDLALFTGYITDVQPADDKLRFRVEGMDKRRDTELPPNSFEPEVEGFASGKDGDPIPMAFGHVAACPGRITSHVADKAGTATGPVVKFVDTTVLSVGGLDEMIYADPGLKEAGGFARIMTGTAPNLTYYSAYAIYDADGEVAFYDPDIERLHCFIVLKPTGVTDDLEAGYEPATNQSALVRNIFDTVVTLLTASGSTYSAVLKLPSLSLNGDIQRDPATRYTGIFLRPAIDIALNTDGEFQAFFPTLKALWEGSINSFLATRVFDDSDNGSYDLVTNGGPSANWQFRWGTSADWSNYSTLTALTAKFLKLIASGTDPSYVELYNLRVSVAFTIDLPTDGYHAEMDGYLDDGSGTITGTASTLLTNPAHIAAALWHFWGNDPDVYIAEHRLVAGGLRAGWLFGRALTDREDLVDIIDGLCREALLWAWTDEEGQSRLFPMDDPGGVDFLLRPDLVQEGRLDVSELSPLDEVVTDFSVKYAFNRSRDEYDGVVFCNPDDSSAELGATYESACAWSKFNNGGVSKRETYELEWVEDRDTAVAITKKLIAWHGARRRMIEWTSDLAMLRQQVGDSFRLDWTRPEWPATMRAATYRITMKRHMPKTDTIKFRAVQVF